MFENLSNKLQGVFQKLSGRGHLTEENIDEGLKEIRRALLEADVHFKVVKDFLAKIRIKALGSEVLTSLKPSDMLARIVQNELTDLMGGAGPRHLATASRPPTVILMVGLQGTGKTTTAAKLALKLKNEGRKVMLCAADLSRPAAVDQLQALAKQIDVEVMTADGGEKAPALSIRARQTALDRGFDTLIVDTAGRLAIDEALMQELKEVKAGVKPHEVLLVVDAMAGQDAVDTATRFHEAVGVDGLILTKMDGDARGGAALSVLAATGRPVKFTGTGERVDALEPFHPDRLASRILGMGDVISLVEKVQEKMDLGKAEELARKLKKSNFDFEDFLQQIAQIKKMGSMKDLMGMIPGMGKMKIPEGALDEGMFKKTEAVIFSMTKKERRLPAIIHGERRKRIASGSGTKVEDVNKVLKQFEQMKKMMKMMKKGGKRRGGGMGMQGMPGMGGGGGFPGF